MVVVQSGDVSKLTDRAGYRVPISTCGVVNQQQVIKTGPDGYAKFQVSDGSVFEVFPNSEVTFRKTYGIGDLLNVWMGKVKVYIQHLPGIPNPNNVTTPTALISVRGTIFDVDVQDLEGTTFVTLDEGIVDVRHLRVASGVVRLNPGESIQVLPNTPLVPLARDKGMIFRQVIRGIEDAARQAIYQKPGTVTPAALPADRLAPPAALRATRAKIPEPVPAPAHPLARPPLHPRLPLQAAAINFVPRGERALRPGLVLRVARSTCMKGVID